MQKIPLLASEFPPLQRGIKGDLSDFNVIQKHEFIKENTNNQPHALAWGTERVIKLE